jgi:tetratricopeptide (TPR) repeat protein
MLVLLIIGAVTVYKAIYNAERHEEAGIQLENKLRLAEAEAEYRKAIQLDPNVGRYHWRLAIVLWEQKKYTEVEAEFKTAIRLEPNDTRFQESLKTYLDSQRQHQ